jgi:hypothetical protein
VPALVEAARRAGGGDFRVASYEEVAAGALDLRVDVVVANFALIGGPAVDAVVARVPALLAPGGALVVQTLHPAAAAGDAPYADGWRPGSWTGFGPEFTHPAPWFFRTLGGWVRLLTAGGLRLAELREPVHPDTGRPASAIFVATAGLSGQQPATAVPASRAASRAGVACRASVSARRTSGGPRTRRPTRPRAAPRRARPPSNACACDVVP